MEITGFSTFNLPGLHKIQFVESANILNITSPNENHEVQINLQSGVVWDDLYFTQTTADSKIKQKQDDSGFYYNALIKLVNPKLTPAKAVQFSQLEQKELVFLLEDNNGYKILIGSKEMPARITYSLHNPPLGATRNQREISIDAIHDIEPYYVAVQATIIGGGFSSGFSSGFRI